MASYRPPKQTKLTANETITTFENWRQNLLFLLRTEERFAPYLEDDCTWAKKTAAKPLRGFTDDVAPIAEAARKTAAQKNAIVEQILNQIANYADVVARNMIVKQCVSVSCVWQKLREHYGFQSTGAHFLDLSLVKLESDERPEALYQRLYSFFEDNLMTTTCNITHHGENIDADEELTPSMENILTWLWLKLINPALPQLIKQKYGTELRNKSLSSIKVEISHALPSLIDELATMEETKVFRSTIRSNTMFGAANRNNKQPQKPSRFGGSTGRANKSCVLCKPAGRSDAHWLSECRYLPDPDRRALARARAIQEVDENWKYPEGDETSLQPESCSTGTNSNPDPLLDNTDHIIRRVSSEPSPVLITMYQDESVRVTLDSGATTNLVHVTTAKRLNMPILPASQMARQADGKTLMSTVGEIHVTLTRGELNFTLDALVVKELDVEILGSMPFMKVNDIAVRPAKYMIVIGGKTKVFYNEGISHEHKVRRAQSFVLRGPAHRTVILPGEFILLETPKDVPSDIICAVEPRFDNASPNWIIPQEIQTVDHTVSLKNVTTEPVIINKNAHVCQIRSVINVDDIQSNIRNSSICDSPVVKSSNTPYSSTISIDPDNIVSADIKVKCKEIHQKYDHVFNPDIGKYNGASGNIQGNVNMGPTLPPQRKGRLPQYPHEKLVTLQQKMDELESLGVFAKPEDLGIIVEYLNMTFLVPRPDGDNRLVTSFCEVGQFSKPQPSLMPCVNDTIRAIGKWKFLIKTDLKKAFFQIPLAKSSMRFCGVTTPFKGVRIYTRCAMGMPGSETALEEIMNRVLGIFVERGNVAKIADDLYVGGDSPGETLSIWSEVLESLSRNNLSLSGPKTIIFPKSTIVLGWIWSQGTLQASSHKINALASVDLPSNVRGLRSFIGAYKVLSRVLKGYAQYMQPLEQIIAGKKSHDKIQWDENMSKHFKNAQASLADTKIIHIPTPDDILSIVSDGANKVAGIAATLFALRDGKLLLAGFFNAQLKKCQSMWLPCETEALGIGSAVNHFSPYIVQSKHQTQFLTDSKPCVQAYKKMCRGEFSASARLTTFLSAISRYNINVQHIAGASIVFTDYASRNPIQCDHEACQVCLFINEMRESVVRYLSVKDVLSGQSSMPFTSRAAWIATQRECPDLRRVYAHLHQGTRPTKKMTKIPRVKRYLQCAVIARDGLLVVKNDVPFQDTTERIIVPASVLHGLLTAIHLKFGHPVAYQLTRLSNRYFYAINLENIADEVAGACDQCNALKSLPIGMVEQSTTDLPTHIGSSFAMDVMKRSKQLVLVLRETVTSYTSTMFLKDETHKEIRDGIIILGSGIKCVGTSIRVDPGPGLVALVDDAILKSHDILLEVGRIKNPNKNPVAERAIKELGDAVLKLSPEGGPISQVTLAIATTAINSKIRRDGLSSRELWTQRDQITGNQLPIDDHEIILSQNKSRKGNHETSAKAKAHGKPKVKTESVAVGSLVYVKSDKDKTKARDKYIVTKVVDGGTCQIRKFTKSQFRTKAYDVLLNEIYPIVPITKSCNYQSRHQYQHSSSSSDDSDGDKPSNPEQENSTADDESTSSEEEDAIADDESLSSDEEDAHPTPPPRRPQTRSKSASNREDAIIIENADQAIARAERAIQKDGANF